MRLEERGWYPKNRIVLEEHLERWAARARAGERLVATFDFDNTTIFHDAGEATMRYQLARGALRLSHDELARLLPEEARGVSRLSTGQLLADVRQDLLELYADLSADLSASERRDDFAARMAWLYGALDEEPGIGAGVAYPFLARWVGGHSPDEARALVKEALAWAAREPFARGAWRSALPARSGEVTARFATGIAPLDEMKELLRALEQSGVEVYLISASEQHLVEGAVEHFGYPLPRARVFGMRLALDEGVLLPECAPSSSYPLTWRAGKREVIERFLPAPPVFVAGDSDTDLEMLTSFGETELRLIINRGKRAEITALYDDERTLLQGRDEPNGAFRPARESVLLGGLVDDKAAR